MDTPDGTTVTKTTAIHAPVARVWETLTTPDLMECWLSEGGTRVISDWQVGSPLSFAGQWHGTEYADKGTILALDAESVFRYNYWSGFSKLPDSPESYAVIEFRLTPQEHTTVLSVAHSNLVTEAMYGHANFYWSITLERIRQLAERNVESGNP